MFRIRSSFADCDSCDLKDSYSAIAETNSTDDISKVDVMFIAENPGKDEIKGGECRGRKYPPGTPLIGKAGAIFREMFEKHIEPLNLKYYITNTVLCATIKDGKTVNPERETVERCKKNLFKMIDMCRPKLIVAMGTTAMKAFDIGGSIVSIPVSSFHG